MTSPPESEAAMAEPSEKIRERLARRCVREMRDAVNESGMVTFVRAAIDLAVERAERERDDALFALKETQAAAEARASAEGKARAEERAYIVEQIREHAPDIVLFAGGNTRPLSLLAWLLELPPAPKASGR